MHYALGVDGLGLVMVLLTTLLVPIVLLASWHEADDAGNGGSRAVRRLGARPRGDGAGRLHRHRRLPLLRRLRGHADPGLLPHRRLRSRRSRAGGDQVPDLPARRRPDHARVGDRALRRVRQHRQAVSFLLTDLAALDIDPITQRWLFIGFFVAFAIKAPMFPVHTWLADTTEKATTGTSVLLVCVLDKIGTFGMLRFCLGLLPDASRWATPVVVVLALISIVYGALVAIGQDDILRLIGLTSLSHFGFIVLGIFVFNSQGSRRLDPLHGQPRHRAPPRCSWWPATSIRRRGHRLDPGDGRRRREGRPGAGRHLPDRRSGGLPVCPASRRSCPRCSSSSRPSSTPGGPARSP